MLYGNKINNGKLQKTIMRFIMRFDEIPNTFTTGKKMANLIFQHNRCYHPPSITNFS